MITTTMAAIPSPQGDDGGDYHNHGLNPLATRGRWALQLRQTTATTIQMHLASRRPRPSPILAILPRRAATVVLRKMTRLLVSPCNPIPIPNRNSDLATRPDRTFTHDLPRYSHILEPQHIPMTPNHSGNRWAILDEAAKEQAMAAEQPEGNDQEQGATTPMPSKTDLSDLYFREHREKARQARVRGRHGARGRGPCSKKNLQVEVRSQCSALAP